MWMDEIKKKINSINDLRPIHRNEKKWGSNLNKQKNNQTSLLFFFFFAMTNMLFLGGEKGKREGRKNTLLELNRQSDHCTLLITLSHHRDRGNEMHWKTFWTLTFRVFFGATNATRKAQAAPASYHDSHFWI
jgi:hypothetical protein